MELASRWRVLCDAVGASGDRERVLGMLESAYGDPRRGYHDLRHLTEVLDHVDELAEAATSADVVRLAAWFHDAVYDAVPGDEERSAGLAETLLPALGMGPSTVAAVARLVRLTASHAPEPGDHDGEVLCDADLAVLARDRAGYDDYVRGVRAEYAHVPDELFRAGRASVLEALLRQPRLFRTDEGHRRWESAARRNMTAELTRLRHELRHGNG